MNPSWMPPCSSIPEIVAVSLRAYGIPSAVLRMNWKTMTLRQSSITVSQKWIKTPHWRSAIKNSWPISKIAVSHKVHLYKTAQQKSLRLLKPVGLTQS